MKQTDRKNNNGSYTSKDSSYGKTLHENKSIYGYRPSGASSSDEFVPPDCESSVQNVNKNT